MIIAIIVVSVIAALGLVMFFVAKYLNWRRGGVDGVPRKPSWQGVKTWFVTHAPSKRRLIQVYAMLLYNANIKGYISGEIYTSSTTKYMCVPGLNCYSCPGAVGACPLGALQNALASSNTRAPYYMLGIIALFGLICARTVCGLLCPVGMCQELLYKIRTPKLKKSRVTRVLSYFKYVILALTIALPIIYAGLQLPLPPFCKYVCPAGTFEGAILLLVNPANEGYFVQLGGQFTWKFALLIAFVVASIFIFRVFCRFICPLGAIYGFFNKFALIGVTVDKNDCTECGLCVSHCKMDVKRVGDHECINCGECISVCPTKAISWKGSKIFLHKNTLEEPVATEEAKPLAVTAGALSLKTPADEIKPGDASIDTAANAAASVISETPEPQRAEERSAERRTKKTEPPKKKRGARFWAEVAAWSVAVVVLITALIFYNFVDVPKADENTPPVDPDNPDIVVPDTGYKVGEIAPDFTVKLYGEDGEFNLYSNRGKVTVINFWATWCNPCVAEIPYFNDLVVGHPELNVIAIHGSSGDDVNAFMAVRGWDEYELTFAQDNISGDKCLTFRLLGGRNAWPLTVIVDENGKVIYNSPKSFHSYDELEKAVLKAIADGKA